MLRISENEFFRILESEKVSKFGNFRAIWSNFGVKKVISFVTHCYNLALFG